MPGSVTQSNSSSSPWNFINQKLHRNTRGYQRKIFPRLWSLPISLLLRLHVFAASDSLVAPRRYRSLIRSSTPARPIFDERTAGSAWFIRVQALFHTWHEVPCESLLTRDIVPREASAAKMLGACTTTPGSASERHKIPFTIRVRGRASYVHRRIRVVTH